MSSATLVRSVNTSVSRNVVFEGKEWTTGYFKEPAISIFLRETGVQNDTVADHENHGGTDKACYLFGFNHYPHWQALFPHVPQGFGMFGENITLDMLHESDVRIGDTFEIGEAVVQVTQPRQPCFKMGIRFDDQRVVKAFREFHSPGIYVKVLKDGHVTPGDPFRLLHTYPDAPTVLDTFRLIYSADPDRELLQRLLQNEHLASRLKNYLSRKFGPK